MLIPLAAQGHIVNINQLGVLCTRRPKKYSRRYNGSHKNTVAPRSIRFSADRRHTAADDILFNIAHTEKPDTLRPMKSNST